MNFQAVYKVECVHSDPDLNHTKQYLKDSEGVWRTLPKYEVTMSSMAEALDALVARIDLGAVE